MVAMCTMCEAASTERITADYAALDPASRLFVRYLVFPAGPVGQGPQPPGVEPDWLAAACFVVGSSSRAVNLEATRPVRIDERTLRIDLRALRWDYRDLVEVLARDGYPYSTSRNPLEIRGDWLALQLSDASESDAYLRLMVGGKEMPQTADEFFRAFEVDRKEVRRLQLDHGLVEAQSQVAMQRVRSIEFFSRLGGHASITGDFFKLAVDNSPLEQIRFGDLKPDGQELIVGLPKYWTGGRGTLQVYALAAGSGDLVGEAPVKLVEDRTRFRGTAAIRYPGSCYQCHAEGLNAPTVNGLRDWLASGVEVTAERPELAEFLTRFHLTDYGVTIRRANEDFAAAVKYLTGLEPGDNAANYRAAINAYDRPLTLAAAAAELDSTAEELRLAIAAASNGERVGGSLAALAHGKPIPRTTWESVYLAARSYLRAWEKRNED